jgi:hypothetical protein
LNGDQKCTLHCFSISIVRTLVCSSYTHLEWWNLIRIQCHRKLPSFVISAAFSGASARMNHSLIDVSVEKFAQNFHQKSISGVGVFRNP